MGQKQNKVRYPQQNPHTTGRMCRKRRVQFSGLPSMAISAVF